MNSRRIVEMELSEESFFPALKKRLLQILALYGPGEATLRVYLHRWRGVSIGSGVHIGTAVIIETAHPEWVCIGNGVSISMRATIVAHMIGLTPRKDQFGRYVSVRIEDEAYIGTGAIILPNVIVGGGAVVTAGSVVTRSVPPLTMVQGNPAQPIAKCGIPLRWGINPKQFLGKLKPIDQVGRPSHDNLAAV